MICGSLSEIKRGWKENLCISSMTNKENVAAVVDTIHYQIFLSATGRKEINQTIDGMFSAPKNMHES